MISRLRHTASLTIALGVLWIVLSGKLDALHLTVGALSALGISLGTTHLLLSEPAIAQIQGHPFRAIPWRHLPGYFCWLLWQIVLSSLQVAYLVIHPRMPIHPGLRRFQTALPHTLARLFLAHSITLTPGTVTIDVQEDEFVVHALLADRPAVQTFAMAELVMQSRIAALFRSAGC